MGDVGDEEEVMSYHGLPDLLSFQHHPHLFLLLSRLGGGH